MRLDHESANLKSTGDDWAPQQINMRSKSASGASDNCSRGMPDRRISLHNNKKAENMFESFRNLEDAMEMAKQQSLQSTKEAERSTMIQSFRNLDLALAQAKQDSLSECNNDKRTSYHNTGDMLQSFRDLDEATAQAIQNSLSDKGRCMFESFRNLDGALDQAMMDSLDHCANGDKKKSTSKSRGQKIDTVYEADFDDLEDAIKLAMDASLRDEDNGNAMDGSFSSCGNVGKLGDSAIGKGDYQYLAQLQEEGAASPSLRRGSQLDDQMLKKEGRRRSSHGDLGGEEGEGAAPVDKVALRRRLR